MVPIWFTGVIQFGLLNRDARDAPRDLAVFGKFLPAVCDACDVVISSKLADLVPRSQIIQRIEAASRYVPLENLAVSSQCGFASTFEGNLLTEDDQWRKMPLVVDVARQVWGQA